MLILVREVTKIGATNAPQHREYSIANIIVNGKYKLYVNNCLQLKNNVKNMAAGGKKFPARRTLSPAERIDAQKLSLFTGTGAPIEKRTSSSPAALGVFKLTANGVRQAPRVK